ncbi:hypothetical protein J6590_001633 [Homalodisca vitripennis]|nr:hypothetical protein J6590_001633 [Homalodisca vitripennis]
MASKSPVLSLSPVGQTWGIGMSNKTTMVGVMWCGEGGVLRARYCPLTLPQATKFAHCNVADTHPRLD